MSLSLDELRELSQKIADNPDEIYNLEPDQSIQMRKYLNPLGNVVSAKKCYVNMGIINWREKYLRRLHTTALIGYLYRTLEEYEPDRELQREKARFDAASKDAMGVQLEALTKEHTDRNILIKTTARGIVKQFLDRNFEHNPDYHLRKAHTDNKEDPERKPKDNAIRDACATADSSAGIESKLQAKPDATYKYLRSNLLAVYQAAVDATSTLKATLGVLLDPELDTSDKQGILLKKYKQLVDLTADMKKIAEPIAAADTLSAWKVDPPVDVFHQFDRYLTNHYDQLREVVQALYSEKSDFEFAVVLYDAFKTPEAAREYRVQHENEFRSEVFTVENSAVTLIGPFKENRQRVDFYNKNTEVMKKMMEQLEMDHKLGGDLMSKQVKSQKRKNINEAGPDAPGLASYSKVMNTVAELGAKKVLTREELEALTTAKRQAHEIKEDYEVPDEAIQVDMFFPQTNPDGTTTLAKTKFYTQAEVPTFMQDPSRADEPYQPKRDDSASIDRAYKTKVITGRNGEKKEIQVAKGIK